MILLVNLFQVFLKPEFPASCDYRVRSIRAESAVSRGPNGRGCPPISPPLSSAVSVVVLLPARPPYCCYVTGGQPTRLLQLRGGRTPGTRLSATEYRRHYPEKHI